MKDYRYLTGVSTLLMTQASCAGCGMCTLVCPHGVFKMVGKKSQIIDKDGCMECGACVLNCPTGSVAVTPGVGCAAYIIQTWIKGKKLPVSANCC